MHTGPSCGRRRVSAALMDLSSSAADSVCQSRVYVTNLSSSGQRCKYAFKATIFSLGNKFHMLFVSFSEGLGLKSSGTVHLELLVSTRTAG